MADTVPNYFGWLHGMRSPTPAMDAEFKEEDHPRTAQGSSKGGEFRTSGKTIEKTDTLDPAARIRKDATASEMSEIERGGTPKDRFEPVSPDDLPTLKNTNSKYRKARNGIMAAVEARRAAGATDVDGTYPFDDPEHKVQHMGADGQMHDGLADGFQVSFQTTNGEGFNREAKDMMMSDEDYDATVERLAKETGSKPYVGVFGGIPEVSFRCDTLEQAMAIAKKYNQISIADNKRIADDIWDDMTFPFNEDYRWEENQVAKMKND